MAVVMGGGPAARFWHPFFGLAFFGAAMWMHLIWHRDMFWGQLDRLWMARSKEYATNRDDLVPPQGKFNAGQKAFYWTMFYGAMGLIATGLFLWFPEYIPFSWRWLRPIFAITHAASALLTIGAFIIHVYMSIFVVPGSVTAMIQGYVTEDWARTHHRLWYEEVEGKPASGD
jgi:formate dehydrogenase subunit gamma